MNKKHVYSCIGILSLLIVVVFFLWGDPDSHTWGDVYFIATGVLTLTLALIVFIAEKSLVVRVFSAFSIILMVVHLGARIYALMDRSGFDWVNDWPFTGVIATIIIIISLKVLYGRVVKR